ncbi:type VI secretion system baseplate subunit TssE [Rhodobacteraceae bacterium D3-12]|nr:type VI secretion system baseplate subunit TssE [Rhodobacteraceae bacterium D3-12]
MSDTSQVPGARQEAVQPSLWDRLSDDLPGIVAESEGLRKELLSALPDPDAIDTLLEGGARAIEARTDLDDETRLRLHRLLQHTTKQRRLEDSGIVVTPTILREAVRRDIEMLFNVERLEADFLLSDRERLTYSSPEERLEDFPEVRTSVLNFGVPAFSGRKGNDFNKELLARELRQVLICFEPRLKKETVKVEIKIEEKQGMRIEIDGVLMLSPVPERLRLSTMINLESGKASTTVEDS